MFPREQSITSGFGTDPIVIPASDHVHLYLESEDTRLMKTMLVMHHGPGVCCRPDQISASVYVTGTITMIPEAWERLNGKEIQCILSTMHIDHHDALQATHDKRKLIACFREFWSSTELWGKSFNILVKADRSQTIKLLAINLVTKDGATHSYADAYLTQRGDLIWKHFELEK